MSTMTYWFYFIFHPVIRSSCSTQSFNKKTMSDKLIISPFKINEYLVADIKNFKACMIRKKETRKAKSHLVKNFTHTAWKWAKYSLWIEPPDVKTNNVVVRPAKTRVSLNIRQVWSESSLSAWRKLGSLATHWSTTNTLIRLGGCPGWSESLLGAHAILLVLSRGGSSVILTFSTGSVLLMQNV